MSARWRHRPGRLPVGAAAEGRAGEQPAGEPGRPAARAVADGRRVPPGPWPVVGDAVSDGPVGRCDDWKPPAPLLRVIDRRRGSLLVTKGELVSVVGLSGAGKTRWVRSLVGLHDPFDVALLDGQPMSPEIVAKSVGWVAERGCVLQSETVLGNVMVPVGVPVARERAFDALDLVGLAGRASDRSSSLSGSEQRRVALARCIARRARLVVIDGALDSVLWPLFPSLCHQLPFVDGVIVTQSCVDGVTESATSVALLSRGTVVVQDSLDRLRRADDPGTKQALGVLER